jgi:hypothetical protein|tara:strand:+ start:704 stop:1069 length:366 start_codon:yes stop_codon:yes gene_type:complete
LTDVSAIGRVAQRRGEIHVEELGDLAVLRQTVGGITVSTCEVFELGEAALITTLILGDVRSTTCKPIVGVGAGDVLLQVIEVETSGAGIGTFNSTNRDGLGVVGGCRLAQTCGLSLGVGDI